MGANVKFFESVDDVNNCFLTGNNNLTIIHQNIRSMNRNFDSFITYLNCWNKRPDIIVLSETWTQSENDAAMYNIEGYDRYHAGADFTRASGIIIFVATEAGITCSEITANIIGADSVLLECRMFNYCFSILGIYRWHGVQIENFLDSLNELLEGYQAANCFIIGDINIDISRIGDIKTLKYLEMLFSNGYECLIDMDTRLLNDSSSCLDHIFFRSALNKRAVSSAVIESQITDHRAVAVSLSKSSCENFRLSSTEKSIIDYDKLNSLLMHHDWSSVYFSNDVNFKFNTFIGVLNNYLKQSKYTILVNLTSHDKKLKPWMTEGLCAAIKNRDKLYKKMSRNPNDNKLKSDYLKFKKKLVVWINEQKHRYFSHLNVLPIQQQWKEINKLCGQASRKQTISLQIGGTIVREDQTVAKEFNNYFAKAAVEVTSSVKPLSDENKQLLRNKFKIKNYYNSIFLEPFHFDEIDKLIQSLKNGKSPGMDGFSGRLLKIVSTSIIPVLCDIFNSSISCGVFPDALKIAKVVPIYKKGSKTDIANYRPVSLLSVFSKILEKLVKKRIVDFFNVNKFFYSGQFGFQQGLSTEIALNHFMTNIYNSLNTRGKMKVSGLFLDIKKAFDTVDHDILINKLFMSGVRGIPLKWFKSYLENRSQCVSINGINSELVVNSNCGVPQGSVLGPLLFLVYINDLFSLNFHGSVTSFADDTALAYSANSINELQMMLQSDLSNLRLWFDGNKIVLNASKTNFINFSLSTVFEFSVPLKYHEIDCQAESCKCNSIYQANSLKYLGMTLDDRLIWTNHITNLKCRLLFLIRKFYNLQQFLPRYILRQLYFAFFHSKLDYGLSCWMSTYACHYNPVVILQKAIIRIICGVKRRIHSFPYFKILQVLPLRSMYVFKVLSLFFKMSGNRNMGIAPETHPMGEVVTRQRTRELLATPRPYCTRYKKSFVFLGCKYYNLLPTDIRRINSLTQFKVKVKKWLLSLSFEDLMMFIEL